VDLFYTLTEFAREKFIEIGIPGSRIVVKPNFIDPDPGTGAGHGGYAVFVGRLSAEKGIETMLDAWTRFHAPIPLKIIGDGPLSGRVAAAAKSGSRIQWLGRRTLTDVYRVLGDAVMLVMPSVCYETFGRTVMESYAKGTPVIVSRLGAMNEIVHHGETGLKFAPGNSADLADCVRRLVDNPQMLPRLRSAARQMYVRNCTADRNYEMLVNIYRRVGGERVANRNSRNAGAERGAVPETAQPMADIREY
jgi:glycosyltransferase involved in cell wall biosynthesis